MTSAIRRVLVPPGRREDCVEALEDQLGSLIVGNPADASVRVGPLVNAATAVHAREVFGPAVTVMDYRSVENAAAICARGDGALVSSVYSNDRRFAREMLLALAPYHGRLTLGGEKVAGFAPAPGAVMPAMVHGGPGRAGGGEELGGLRGLSFYLQRTAVQGYQPLLEKFFPGAE